MIASEDRLSPATRAMSMACCTVDRTATRRQFLSASTEHREVHHARTSDADLALDDGPSSGSIAARSRTGRVARPRGRRPDQRTRQCDALRLASTRSTTATRPASQKLAILRGEGPQMSDVNKSALDYLEKHPVPARSASSRLMASALSMPVTSSIRRTPSATLWVRDEQAADAR